MQAIDNQEWQSLPEQAQQEIYDFFLFIKQRYEKQVSTPTMMKPKHCYFQIIVPI